MRWIVNIIFLSVAFCENNSPEVQIKDGKLRGKYMTTKEGRQFSGFTGIPFAKPALGELRFKPPVPIEPWQGTLEATSIHSVCPQRDIYRRSTEIEGEEDCLYLNVYTPKLPNAGEASLPVMIFFHGGGWLCGGGNSLWYGPEVLLDRDVVLVVTNYRLGALGFLTTGDDVVAGNNGLKDQNLAIKWTKENVAKFGGNPDSITIFGESAGGASVQYHMVSPLSRDLISGGISQSGTPLCIWAHAPEGEGIKNGKKLAKSLGCPTNNNERMVDCLRKIDANKLVEQDSVFFEWDLDPMIPFKPTVEHKHDGAFLSEHPIETMKKGQQAKVPIIVGLNTEDGALRGAGIFGNPHLLDEINQDFDRVIPISLMYDKTAKDIKGITQRIKHFYFNDMPVSNSSKKEIVNMYTDGWFLNCADEAVRLHKKYSTTPVYYYLFGHRGTSSLTKLFGDPINDYGVCHADELQYLFPLADGLFPENPPSDDDKKVAKIMTNLWANFAKTGNPTPATNDVIPEVWQPVKTDNMEYYYIDAEWTGMKEGLLIERAKFWRTLKSNPRKQLNKDEL
ncbi:unnamed protein product [Brassicogethes aeneus]|uniref:Carboxylic ester hydrolase n=1 Tax=Brassicogethes aeneus TaxID=1431903 RepID=A0A9P0FIK3_BRAAE|nr:unnamed protein product [Brassicogethes aeneus]